MLQWGRGLEPAETASPRRSPCGSTSSRFNGAAGLNPRRQVPCGAGGLNVPELQWGRGLEPAETAETIIFVTRHFFTSRAAGLNPRRPRRLQRENRILREKLGPRA